MLVCDGLAYAHAGQQHPYLFDLEALPGEITAVSGPSGSGKSTLLDLIAGFLRPSSGQLTLDGVDLVALPPEVRPVSILFQSDMLFAHLSAGTNASLGLQRGLPRHSAKAQVAQALREVGLPDIGGQRASTLSGGQQQRVALARTLLRRRPVLLLDEPFSALDDIARAAMRALVRRLTEEKRWHTLLVSHHADDIAALASRAYRIEDRRLLRA